MPTQRRRADDLFAERRMNANDRAAIDAELEALINEVLPPPPPLHTVSIGANVEAKVGEAIAFNAVITGGQGPFSGIWDMGDGAVGTAFSLYYPYAAPGFYVVGFLCTDALGRQVPVEKTVTVVALPVPVPVSFDPTKAPTGLAVLKNPDGTVTSSCDVSPGATGYKFFHIPMTNPSDYSRAYRSSQPTWTTKPVPDGKYRFATSALGKHPTTGKIVESKGNSNFTFTYPDVVPPPPPPPDPVDPPTPPPDTIQPRPFPAPARAKLLLLSKGEQNRIRDLAALATAQWKDFFRPLTKSLDRVIQGEYQGSQLSAIPNNALAYVILKDDYPEEAAKYAYKAIAGIKSAMYDNQKGPNAACSFLERSDGIKTTFVVPHADFKPATFRAYLGTVGEKVVTKSAAVTDPKLQYNVPYERDNVLSYAFYRQIIGEDGEHYWKDLDWQQDTFSVVWEGMSGKKPAVGSKYTLTYASVFGVPPTPVKLVGNQFTFLTPPRDNQAVFVEYMYGNYEQTGGGVPGGFQNIKLDASYPSRHLGKNVALGMAWLGDFASFPDDLFAEAGNMVAQWADFAGSPWAYLWSSGASNYSIGAYVSRCLTAAALAGTTGGEKALATIIGWRQAYLVPALTASTKSQKGGFWCEGFSYGSLSVQNVLLSALALEAVGVDVSIERAWASDVARFLVHGSMSGARPSMMAMGDDIGTAEIKVPTVAEGEEDIRRENQLAYAAARIVAGRGMANDDEMIGRLIGLQPQPSLFRSYADHCAAEGCPVFPPADAPRMAFALSAASTVPTIFDGGDWFVYPATMPGRSLLNMLATVADAQTARGYAQRIANEDTRPPSFEWPSLVFGNPSRPTATWEDKEPLQWFAEGTGTLVARSNWEAA